MNRIGKQYSLALLLQPPGPAGFSVITLYLIQPLLGQELLPFGILFMEGRKKQLLSEVWKPSFPSTALSRGRFWVTEPSKGGRSAGAEGSGTSAFPQEATALGSPPLPS